jgi:signal transduction histidine kinase
MQEFINIAAHELCTPIQSVLGLSQMLRVKLKNTEFVDLLDSHWTCLSFH